MKTKKLLLLLSLCLCSIVISQNHISNSQKNDISTFVKKTIEELEITGVAMAIVKDNQTIYKDYFGKANLEYDIPITKKSLFRLHSLSKIFVSVGIFQLIEQNKINLDDKISKHLTDLPDTWKDIQIKHLLTHSSGLPDMIDEKSLSEEIATKNVYTKKIQFLYGERSDYNQTGFWLLNRIIRKVTNGSFDDFITSQFTSTQQVCFTNALDIVPNRVMEYKPNNKGKLRKSHFVVPEYLYGAAGITMTLEDFIAWDKSLNENLLISTTSKEKMFTPFDYKIGTGYTYGWNTQKLNGITSYGFSGGRLVNYRIFPSKNISVIWFTNGNRIPYRMDKITNKILGFIDKDLIDHTPEFISSMAKIVDSEKSNNKKKAYKKLKEKFPHVDYELAINIAGYEFLRKEEINKAIVLFKLNVEEFPKSGNTYDSLAEGYFYNKEFDLSKENYLKSLELNPLNHNAKMMLKKIETNN